MMESLSLQKQNIIKDMRNLFRLKRELNYTAIKDIRNLFRLQSVTKIIETHYIFIKNSHKMLDFAQRYPKFLLLLFNVVRSLEQLCQAVVAKNNKANLQPTLHKRAGDASLTIFVTYCLQSQKRF